MGRSSNAKAPKQATNLTVRKDLLEAARAAGLNLSAVMEEALGQKLAEAKREQWLRENRDAIEAYNGFTQENGTFGDRVRSF